MNKKILWIGMGLLCMGMVTALLVSYLSNTSNLNVSVESPMSLTFADGSTELALNMYGGDGISYGTLARNKANQSIQVYKVVHEIEAPVVWSGNEFDYVYLTDRGVYVGNVLGALCHVKPDGSLIPFNEIGSLNVTKAKLIVAEGCVANKYTHGANSVIDNEINISISAAIYPGMYRIRLCHLYSLTGSCV